MTCDVFEHQTVRQSKKIPYGTIHDDVALSFLLTNDYYCKKFFDKWQGSVIDPVTNLVNYPQQYKTDVIIQQLDRNNTPIYGVKLIGAYPTGVNSIELSNESADAKHSLSVTMVYDRFEVEGAISSLVGGVKNKLGALRRLI